ncbi:MAG: glycoside hydrolase family 9 protein [Wujia sp.]
MRRFKKTAAVLLAAAMALSLCACGKTEDKKDSSATTVEQASDSDATTSNAIEDDGNWPTTEQEVVEDDRFTTVEGADAIGVNFDDGSTSGFTSYTNNGNFTMYVENGELVCDITKSGPLEHSCQIYYDGFTMAKGCVYTISFDVHCDIERVVQWRVQVNGGDYHAYANDFITVGPETQTITMDFTMEENSDPAPRFVVNMGTQEGQTEVTEAHKIYFDNLSLFVKDSSNAEKIEGAPTPIRVKVNQIGYKPSDVKTVIVTSKDDEKFKIVDAETEETMYVGAYGELSYDKSVESNVRHGDFTEFTTPGTYKIISSPSGASYTFSIGDDLYDDIYKDVVLMLYKQRCGTEVTKDIAGNFAHEACHMQEASIYGDTSGTKVDVSGGWHDAGDYGRYVVPGAKTVQDLFLAYEDYGQDADDFGIPESGNKIPDLLDEAKYELDWMLKMQDAATGGVYHKVTALVFPETVLAVDETDDMVLAPISYAATADFAAVMAKASVLYAEFDADFAKSCLDAATAAYAFLEANPDMKGYENPTEIVTGAYDDMLLKDETLWASAELYLATGEDKYLQATKAALDTNYLTGLGWADIGTYALYDLAKNDNTDASVKETAKQKLLADTDEKLAKSEAEGLFTGLGVKYPWGSNMTIANNGMQFLLAAKLTGDAKYTEYAQKMRDYIFGVNGTGYCYVTGYGTLTPKGTHHRPSQVLGETMPGMLVGGANNNLDDPYANAVLYGIAPGLAYVDNEQCYSCNEITIYWNSPLIYLLTGLN